jgi:hypothetical protein
MNDKIEIQLDLVLSCQFSNMTANGGRLQVVEYLIDHGAETAIDTVLRLDIKRIILTRGLPWKPEKRKHKFENSAIYSPNRNDVWPVGLIKSFSLSFRKKL